MKCNRTERPSSCGLKHVVNGDSLSTQLLSFENLPLAMSPTGEPLRAFCGYGFRFEFSPLVHQNAASCHFQSGVNDTGTAPPAKCAFAAPARKLQVFKRSTLSQLGIRCSVRRGGVGITGLLDAVCLHARIYLYMHIWFKVCL